MWIRPDESRQVCQTCSFTHSVDFFILNISFFSIIVNVSSYFRFRMLSKCRQRMLKLLNLLKTHFHRDEITKNNTFLSNWYLQMQMNKHKLDFQSPSNI